VAAGNNNVEVLFRSHDGRWDIYEYYSTDGAATWSLRRFAIGGSDNRTRWPRVIFDHLTWDFQLVFRTSFNEPPERIVAYTAETPWVWTANPGTISDLGNEPSYAYPPALCGKFFSYLPEPWVVWLKYDGDYSLYYDGASPPDTMAGSISCIPASGTVPFRTQMTVTLENLYTDQTRQLAGSIHVTLASGAHYSNWRRGHTNVAGGDDFTVSWGQMIPAQGSLIGDNYFRLIAADITPAPYNQPPYPPAGDVNTQTCVVTGVAP
jgi:hypothetical protein